MPGKHGGGGGAAAPAGAGDPFTPEEFVPGLVVLMDGFFLDKSMSGSLADTCKPYSCPDNRAVLQPHSFVCLGRREGGRPERSFWAPLFPSEGAGRELLDMATAQGHPAFTKGAMHIHKEQVWVVDDDVVIEAAQRPAINGKRTLVDMSTKSRRNKFTGDGIPTWENFAPSVVNWAKKAASSVPKEGPAAPERDPNDPSRLFRDFAPAALQLKVSATIERDQKATREELAELFPTLATTEGLMEHLLPKSKLMLVTAPHNTTLVVNAATNEVIFFRHLLSPWLPTLRTLHQVPSLLPKHRVDIGGCKFVVSGANLMCQGLTSAGGSIAPGVNVGDAVAVYVEGKQHAAAVGYAALSSEDIASVNQGVCVVSVHHLMDGLWVNPTIA
mmetsp:Transcript_4873/g.15424  ORF Transcript_4873/g.15424 Transcript_4873/m.15424 type:complete len:386 (-) Transcript_4873:55-1212(-)|eukprot:CAMPEP_0174851434 /NCGR_PEP_ID=MMETSP1114-20130205/23188_1 /TAXON_ID=312471 /ORGANISM="Neobodo designis, Strain CCAP 1951/1" /LENGTH=385 /DNA_ID=CAMNT_0016085971 /DNA_START=27 /DNA_END=1184 /DNA_ORIENTATION=-